MKARTKLEVFVTNNTNNLFSVTQYQKDWVFENVVAHLGYATSKTLSCMSCGYVGSSDIISRKRATCPSCERKLKVKYTFKRKVSQKYLVAHADVYMNFQIIRFFEVQVHSKKGEKPRYYFSEVLQKWEDEKTRKITMIGNLRSNSYYSDYWGSDWSIRKSRHSYYGDKYNVSPDAYIPDCIIKKEYKKYGFDKLIKSNSIQVNILDVVKRVEKAPKLETLIKAKQYKMFNYVIHEGNYIVERYWDSVKICLRNKYKPKDAGIWFDYLKNLDHLGKDLRNAKYVCPQNLNREHDRYLKKREKLEKEREYKRLVKKMKEDNLKYLKDKKRFIGLEFSYKDLNIRFLNNVQEVKQNAEELHHCAYTNSYHLKKTLLFSVELKGKTLATAEVNHILGKVVQVRGDWNDPTEHDKTIIKILNKNMEKIIKAGKVEADTEVELKEAS